MPSAATIRLQVESALTRKIPSALTPSPGILRQTVPTGIHALDEVLHGGLPIGAISELVAPECSGRTTVALSFLARITQAAKICAWIDVSNCLHPESAAAAGVDLSRMLWVRCGVTPSAPTHPSANDFALPEKYLIPPPIKKGLHGGGFGPHPRTEAKGLSEAVTSLLRPDPRPAESQPKTRKPPAGETPSPLPRSFQAASPAAAGKPWSRLDQALRVTDLLLQSGGFSAIVLDMGSIAPEHALRVPLATWFRYRAAAERSQISILLLSQHACAKSSAGLVLRLNPGKTLPNQSTVFNGMEYGVEVERERFNPTPTDIVPLRKPPQSERHAAWQSQTAWSGRR